MGFEAAATRPRPSPRRSRPAKCTPPRSTPMQGQRPRVGREEAAAVGPKLGECEYFCYEETESGKRVRVPTAEELESERKAALPPEDGPSFRTALQVTTCRTSFLRTLGPFCRESDKNQRKRRVAAACMRKNIPRNTGASDTVQKHRVADAGGISTHFYEKTTGRAMPKLAAAYSQCRFSHIC